MVYIPSPEVAEQLKEKTLIMIVGPTAVGKSTLMNKVVQLHPDFSRVSGVTTRPPRPNDEKGMYRYITDDQANDMIHARSLVQYAVFPTTGMLYGSEPIDYPGAFNMLDMLSGAVGDTLRLPFKRHIVVSLTAEPDAWLKWADQRFLAKDDEYRRRMQEAVMSIEWSLDQGPSHAWIVNDPTNIDTSAHHLITTALGGTTNTSSGRYCAQRLLQTIRSLL